MATSASTGKSSAQHWCSMIQNFAEGKLENLDYELQRDALAPAIALAPDLKTKAFVAEKYAIRRCKIEGDKSGADLSQ